MRPLISLAAGTLLVAAGALAGVPGSAAPRLAQGNTPGISSHRTINLTEEDRHTIREIVLKDADAPKAPAGTKAEIGDIAPQGIPTHPFPEAVATKIPALKTHTYFVNGDQIVVVDSKDGKIADIVKATE